MNSSISRGCRRLAALAALLGALLATVPIAAADELVREYVDQITAVSIMVPLDAMVFARERSDLAANARDYITLTPLEINRTGKRSYFWSGYVWSTIDRRDRQAVVARGDQLVLLADGRPIPLLNDEKPLRDHGVGEPPTRMPKRNALAVLFAAEPEVMEYVAHADDVHIELIHDGVSETFGLWKDERAGLKAFVERLQ